MSGLPLPESVKDQNGYLVLTHYAIRINTFYNFTQRKPTLEAELSGVLEVLAATR
jgi:hypothetical protein